MSKECESCATQASIDAVEAKMNKLQDEIRWLKIGLRRFRDREAARLQIPAADFLDVE
mgnify:CR=1 FL=1